MTLVDYIEQVALTGWLNLTKALDALRELSPPDAAAVDQMLTRNAAARLGLTEPEPEP